MKLPKNFRQIGEAAGLTKIYIEDYVMTYLSAITKDSRTYVRGAILFGEIQREDSFTYVFVKGAMEAQNIELDLDETVFDDEVWKKIYDTKEQYFGQAQVVGWYLCRMGMSIRLNDKIKKTHFENFPGDGKILYVRDPLEEEEAMYAYRGQDLLRQNGYYIYYVKNKEMQEYLIDKREENKAAASYERMLEQKRDERIVRQSRKRLSQKRRRARQVLGKAVAAAFLMFFMGASATYLLFGGNMISDQTVAAISNRLRQVGKRPEKEKESVSAVFTSDTAAEEASGTDGEKAEAMTGKDVYTVQRGDTLTKISKAVLGSKDYVEQIMEENNLQAGDSIYPGQELKIPVIK